MEIPKVNMPVQRCWSDQHFSNVMAFGTCSECKRSSWLIYDYD